MNLVHSYLKMLIKPRTDSIVDPMGFYDRLFCCYYIEFNNKHYYYLYSGNPIVTPGKIINPDELLKLIYLAWHIKKPYLIIDDEKCSPEIRLRNAQSLLRALFGNEVFEERWRNVSMGISTAKTKIDAQPALKDSIIRPQR